MIDQFLILKRISIKNIEKVQYFSFINIILFISIIFFSCLTS